MSCRERSICPVVVTCRPARSAAWSAAWALAWALAGWSAAAQPARAEGYFAIAHMTNSADAVNWAVDNGANGLEMDLRFDGEGKPTHFRHGLPCDCTCFTGGVCKHLGLTPCLSEVAADAQLKLIAGKPQVALVVIDSKVDDKTPAVAGTNVVRLLVEHLFGNGYRGSVIVGAPQLSDFAYLQAAAVEAGGSAYASRIYFTVDGEGDRTVETITKLTTLPSRQRVYGTGISACSPKQFHDAIALGALNRAAGVIGLDYIWTIDKSSSMRDYLRAGAHGVMTNDPPALSSVLRAANLPLAPPGGGIGAVTSDSVVNVPIVCDCDYHPGGCTISKAAPANAACDCIYKGAWTCGGEVVMCQDPGSPDCTNPSTSVGSCIQGGGDCEGYKGVTCDCDYHPGGCAISKAAPRDAACQCSYKGAWTCGGEIVRCADPSSPFCQNPGTTIESCVQGRGECEGYKNVTCDCDYHPGGCAISKAAPTDTACKCKYKGAWTCGGDIVRCADPGSPFCKSPGTTIESCVQGNGDCGGYRDAKCDCDYHRGGCSISMAAPSTTACKCKYKGAWTCGGEVVRCRDDSSSYCLNPDKSLNSCLQGGGDCGAYK
jgi:glycerophosphoryl diester phosphodiesterase